MTTDTLIRDPETGQFQPGKRRQIVEEYLREQHDATLSELLAAYEQLHGTVRGKLMFG